MRLTTTHISTSMIANLRRDKTHDRVIHACEEKRKNLAQDHEYQNPEIDPDPPKSQHRPQTASPTEHRSIIPIPQRRKPYLERFSLEWCRCAMGEPTPCGRLVQYLSLLRPSIRVSYDQSRASHKLEGLFSPTDAKQVPCNGLRLSSIAFQRSATELAEAGSQSTG